MSELHEATRKIRSLWTAQEERKRRAQRTGKCLPVKVTDGSRGRVNRMDSEERR